MKSITDDIEPAFDGYYDMLWDTDFYGWEASLKDEEALEKFKQFLEQYGYDYKPENLDFIKKYFNSYISIKGVDTRLAQVYSYLGIYKKEYDPYLAFVEKLQKYFSLDKNILDVASGDFPAFGIKIAERQFKLESGNITLYDPNLALTTPLYPNMKLYRQKFDNTVDISNFSLVTSTLPCEITKELLDRLIDLDKEFFIVLCSCYTHQYGKFIGHENKHLYKNIVDYCKSLCETRQNGNLIIDTIDSKYNISQPILIYKHNK